MSVSQSVCLLPLVNKHVSVYRHIVVVFFVTDPSAFAYDFSSGFLLGELLFKFGLQNDFDEFSQNKYVTLECIRIMSEC